MKKVAEDMVKETTETVVEETPVVEETTAINLVEPTETVKEKAPRVRRVDITFMGGH